MDNGSLNNIIASVGFEKNWTPKILGELYLEHTDYEGLIFWYNSILEEIAKNNNKQNN